MIELMQGDCLEVMKEIPDGSVDMVLTDPPYGTAGGMGKGEERYKRLAESSWDLTIETVEMFEQCNRVLRTNGALILFAQEPYTSRIITQAHGNLPFSYRMVWLKDHFANCLVANKAPVSYTEDVCVFRKRYDTTASHPLLGYFHQADERAKKAGIRWNEILGNGMASHYFTKGVQFCIPTASNYKNLQKTGFFEIPYCEVLRVDKEYRDMFKVVFNLDVGQKYKSNVLKYKKDYGGLHPTQKPVALMEDLVRTYTNEGETVLDFTMGCGTTGVACKNLGRDFIGIELDQNYFDIAEQRIAEASQ